MRFFGYILAIAVLPLLLAFTAVDSPKATTEDSLCSDVPDSLRRTYRHTEAVQSLVIKGDTLEARRIWLEIIEQDSTYSPALYNLSRIEQRMDRIINYARRAYLADSTNRWYTENFANSLIDNHHYTEAIPIYRHLIELDPQAIQGYHALAMLYHIGGMPYSAIAILDSAEIHNGYNSYLAGIKQNLLIDTRQYDKAIAEGLRITEEQPYDIEAITSLAIAYEASGRDSLARKSYEQAFRIDSTNIKTINAIIDYYQRAGNSQRMLDYEERIFRDERITIDEKLRRLEGYTSNIKFYHSNFFRIGGLILLLVVDNPDNRQVIDVYASHMIVGGEKDQALDYLRKHLDKPSTTAIDYISVLQLEEYLGKQELMDEDMTKALQRFPQSTQLLAYSAFQANTKGDSKQAIKLMKEALRLAEEDTERSSYWGYIGDIYHAADNDRAAFKAYRKALAYDDNNAVVLNNYAYFLSLMDKDLYKALEMSARATNIEKGNATYIDTYAWILHRLGRNEEAKSVMRQALSLSGQRDAALLAHYADILWALGEKFMAETYWKKAVEVGYDADLMQQHIEQLKQQ